MVIITLRSVMVAPGAPETHLDRMLSIERAKMFGESSVWVSNPGYALLDRYARDLPGVEKLSIVSSPQVVASFLEGRKIESHLRRTDGAFWEIMSFDFVEGSPYTEREVDQGSPVAVINETTRRRFFGDGRAVGCDLRADRQRFTVVGVVRDVPFTRTLSFAEIWVPLTTAKSSSYRDRLLGGFSGILLARNRDDADAINAELGRRLASAQLPDPEHYDTLQAGAYTRYQELARDILGNSEHFEPRPGRLTALIVLLALLFMVLPSLNLINLNLSRILERASEIGVRKAFGASSSTLVGQLLVEGVAVTVLGGLIGLALSALVLAAIDASDRIPYATLQLNWRVFLYGLGLAVVFGILSSAYPAWRMSRLHPVEALRRRPR